MILDVLHFLDFTTAGARAAARARRARPAAASSLLRIGDAAGGFGFTLSKAVDRTVALVRRGRWTAPALPHAREWQRLLATLGFRDARGADERGHAVHATCCSLARRT